MSLRPKRVDFNASFPAFRQELLNMFHCTTDRAKVSGIDMFQQVYDLCTSYPKPHTELLFQSIDDLLREHVSGVLQTILSRDDVVTAYARAWEKYRVAASYANIICEYLNRMLLKMRPPFGDTKRPFSHGRYLKLSVEALAFHIWKETVLEGLQTHHGNRLVFQLLDWIRQDRDGYLVLHDVIYNAINSLVQLNQHTDQPLQLYIEMFENPYLEDTRDYYARESNTQIAQDRISCYMRKIHERLADEGARSARFCHHTSLERVIKECELQCITAHHRELYAEFRVILENERFAAYSLLSRSADGISAMLNIFENFIITIARDGIGRLGSSLTKDPREYAESLMSLQAKYMGMCDEVFAGNLAFTAAVDKAFRSIVNSAVPSTSSSAAELLARYCDLLLKRTAKGLIESEVDDKLSRMITLFKYLDDKDVFQKFYSRMIAKRLIYGTSLSEEAELNMLSRLKVAACGVEYTSKLQRMFTDVTISNDLNVGFSKYAQLNSINLGTEFSILVLTAGSWPLSASGSGFVLPSVLEKSVSQFTTFYGKHHNGRKLTWMHHLARADVKINRMDKRYELNVSLYQLGVLLLFNVTPSLTIHDIVHQTKLNNSEVERILKIFVDINLLTVTDTQTYVVNLGFVSKRTKIKINTALQTETPQEVTAARKAVDDDRKLYLQAAIVRIMKSRKELSHIQLVQQVIDQAKVNFAPSIPVIKRCIEQLIEKQYIDRVPHTRDRYVYIS
ncbi:hypothetical protein SpCBS45565_g06144 [Spizellomyces sp. 'palustris']|nr:hypothetical protein SpCBS45565_g06144 [Spizellomyces sp. 'palustris']